MRPLATGSAADVGGEGFTPARRRHVTVEGQILIEVEQVQGRGRDAHQTAEVTVRCRIHVHATDATEFCHHVAHAGAGPAEAARAATDGTEQVEVADLADIVADAGEGVALHGFPP